MFVRCINNIDEREEASPLKLFFIRFDARFVYLKSDQIVLKLGKFRTAVTPRTATSGGRARGRWKRGSFLFETLFHSSRYEFRLSRYRRVKRKVIFLIVCHLRSCLDCKDPLSLFLSYPNELQKSTHFQEKIQIIESIRNIFSERIDDENF